MAKLKTYSMWRGMVAPQIIGALGLPRHIQQADIIVVAPTKAAALDLITTTPYIYGGRSANELRVDTSSVAGAYAEAGLVDRPRILVCAGVGHPSDNRVIDVAPDGATVVLGHLRHDREDGRHVRRFTPVTPVELAVRVDGQDRMVHIPRSGWNAMTPDERRTLCTSVAEATGASSWSTSEYLAPPDGRP